MTIYMLVGDLSYPGVVEVEAASPYDALDKANAGDFTLFDQGQDNDLDFKFCGPIQNENGIEIEDWGPRPATQEVPSEEPPTLLDAARQAFDALGELAAHHAFENDAPEFNEGGIGYEAREVLRAALGK